MFLNVIMTPVVAGNVIKYDQLQEYFLEGKAFRSFRSAERGTSEHFSNGTAERGVWTEHFWTERGTQNGGTLTPKSRRSLENKVLFKLSAIDQNVSKMI